MHACGKRAGTKGEEEGEREAEGGAGEGGREGRLLDLQLRHRGRDVRAAVA